ncbi:MAG TPA: HEAT repeat domain-containing protein [Lacipirellulaceae bacterium]|nr:HEAT repeat domain-containing protein [Lacipirellulaceae bacterium]
MLNVTVWLCAPALLGAAYASEARSGVTPESPQVRKLVNSALGFLETHTDNRFGAKCLVGLTFIKAGKPDHPRVHEAIEECLNQEKANPPDAQLDVYSNGLAVIFLCECSPQKYAREIDYFVGRMKARQKKHGGWGYHDMPRGDTSQTQYASLAYWEANRHGFRIDGSSLENLANWLTHTQSPEGCWGYQAQVSPTDEPVEQDDATCSLLAAGLGSTYICADLFGLHPSGYSIEDNSKTPVPSALRRVEVSSAVGEPQRFHLTKLNPSLIYRAISRAHSWMEQNYKIDIGPKCYYYLYALERYKSFQEALEGSEDRSPQWYNDGYAFLAKDQASDGSWAGYCGPVCDTAFSTLFLLRSMQNTIHAKLGEGMLLSGRGLPTNLSRAKLHNGQLIVEQVHTKVSELLSMIDDGNEGVLDDLARDPSQLMVDKVDDKSARRLQQLVHGGEAKVRLLAVRALGRSGSLDYVPTLLYALTDPDKRVVLEARNELRFISRNFDGIGPPDDFTEQQRYEAIDAWKKWYKSIRPTAVLEK